MINLKFPDNDAKLHQLATRYTVEVMEIIQDHLDKRDDGRSLRDKLMDHAMRSGMVWVPLDAFRMLQEYEKQLLTKLEMEPCPIIFAKP